MMRSATARAKSRRLSHVRRWKRGLRRVKLRLHPQKTRSSIAKTQIGPGISERSFDFLGYTFRVEIGDSPPSKRFVSFIPAVSDEAAKRMRQEVRRWRLITAT